MTYLDELKEANSAGLKPINDKTFETMKTIPFLTTMLAFVAILLASCDDDNATDGRPPVYDAITLTPNPCAPGDSVTGLVTYTDTGKSLLVANYQFSVHGLVESENGGYTDSVYAAGSWKVYEPHKSQPTFRFKAPDNIGTFTVRFGVATHGGLEYASGGPNGELYATAASISATLTVSQPH